MEGLPKAVGARLAVTGLAVMGLAVMGLVVMGGGCGVTSGSTLPGLSLHRAPAVLSGHFDHGGSHVAFTSTRLGQRAAQLALVVNGKRLVLAADLDRGTLESDGRGAVLAAADRETLRAFAAALAAALNAHGGQPHEWLAPVQAQYWSEAPEGHVHGARSVRPGGAGGGDHGGPCVRWEAGREASLPGAVAAHVGGTPWSCDGTHPRCAEAYVRAQDAWAWSVWRGCSG